MSQMIQAGASVSASLQLAEELRWLHKTLRERVPSVPLRDDFFEQCAALEERVGGDGFRRTRSRAKRLNLLSGLLAVPVLLAVMAGIAADKLMDGFDVVPWMMSNPWVFVLAGVLVVAVLLLAVTLRMTNRALLRREYPSLLERAGLRASR